ncbi:MlaD family protein [Fulvivirga sediminis]|uniref:MCE family protein n=1 Tax=Fulvivirga sediminis TaxID=2803949 RepID=A0A937K2Y6_9BACT|nr:MlaD family protein [Fulvivirga sediminis]MBL3658362.1 MCE family protein [Fulvivirga sediminis]
MEKNIKKDVKLGIFIVIGIAFFIGVVYFLGSQQQLFGDKVRVSATFKNVSGLQPGNNVRFSGIKVGTVKDIEIVSDSTVRAVLLINKESAQFIKNDAFASIVSDGLMGNKIVSISAGTAQAKSIAKDDKLRSKEPVSLDDVVASFKQTSDNAQDLTANLLAISNQIKNAEGLLGKVVSDTTMAHRVTSMVASLEKSSRHAAGITRQVEQAAYQVNHGDGLIARALSDSTWGKQIDHTLDSVYFAGESIAQASRELKDFMTKLNNSKGAIDKLLNDSTVAKDLEQTIINVKKGTDDLDEVMKTINDSWLLNLFSKKDKDKDKNDKKD